MKSFKQFLSESVNIAGDFNGNLYVNSSEQSQKPVGEQFVADIVWEGKLYRLPGNANITGGSWTSLGSESAVEYNATVGTGFTLTGGYPKASGWIAANNPSGKQASGTIGLDPTTSRGNFIAQNIDSNDSNIFAVIVQNLTTNTVTDVYCSLQWRETR